MQLGTATLEKKPSLYPEGFVTQVKNFIRFPFKGKRFVNVLLPIHNDKVDISDVIRLYGERIKIESYRIWISKSPNNFLEALTPTTVEHDSVVSTLSYRKNDELLPVTVLALRAANDGALHEELSINIPHGVIPFSYAAKYVEAKVVILPGITYA